MTPPSGGVRTCRKSIGGNRQQAGLGQRGRERGSVTVEAAMALSALMVVLALCLSGIAAMIAQVRVTDAVGTAARLAARGDDAGARAALERLAPAGSTLTVSGDDLVTAVVRAPAAGGMLPGLTISARAVAAREPDR